MTIKKLAQSFDILVRDGGVGAALFFVVAELIFLNTNSLQYIYDVNSEGVFTWIPAVLGSLAYSITTITVMRKKGHKALKIVFPIFDTLLMFFGLNLNTLHLIDVGEFNLVSFLLSIFFALFTGAITYSIGMINYDEQADEDIDLFKSDNSKLKTENYDLKENETELKDRLKMIERHRTKFEAENKNMKLKLSDFEKKETKMKVALSENTRLKSEIENMRTQIVVFEASRIRKKKPQNRTAEENRILDMAVEINN
ncbi:MAG: hypothetical protein U9Q83_00065 [Bacteroidota bacterium]|nr:hypothetical protein [Bacteroidota bacterium]